MTANLSKVILGSSKKPARSTFMFCATLKEPTEEEKAKGYKAATGKSAFLFSKKDKDTYNRVIKAITAAGKKKFGDSFKFKMDSRKYNSPIHDGDELYNDPDYATGKEAKGMWVVNTKCYKVPQLVDKQNQRVLDPEEIEDIMTSGNYFLASVTFKAYDNESKGIRGELNNLMFIKEGEHLDGSADAETDFADYAMDSDYDDDDDFEEEESPKRKSKSKKSKRRRRK